MGQGGAGEAREGDAGMAIETGTIYATDADMNGTITVQFTRTALDTLVDEWNKAQVVQDGEWLVMRWREYTEGKGELVVVGSGKRGKETQAW